MVTQGQINSELDLSKRIYLYYWDKMADYISVGSDKYIDWYIDLCSIYFIVEAMLSITLYQDKLYILGTEIDEDYWFKCTSDIREYLNNDIRDIVYTELDEQGKIKDVIRPVCQPTIITYKNFYQDWRSIIINVTYNDTSTLTVPFNISEIDQDATRITVNDNDPIHLVQPNEEGCHIVGSTLYWHTYYNLKAGDRVFIQYLINITQ